MKTFLIICAGVLGVVAARAELTAAQMRSALADGEGVLVVRDCQTGEEFVYGGDCLT